MKVIKSPNSIEPLPDFSVFLAGSIEMGVAENWQDRFEKALVDTDIVIFNPRRDDWNPSWVQSKSNPYFWEQVSWELNALENSTIIAMYFDPITKSPISLLELGLFARSGKLIVCCPDRYWRKGNVDIVCEKYQVKHVNTLDELTSTIITASSLQKEFLELEKKRILWAASVNQY